MSVTWTIYQEMINRQLPNIDFNYKLSNSDMKRIAVHLNSSIFVEGECTLWTGYITNKGKKNKAPYVNFFFKRKKTALHRLLYKNFVGSLTCDEYIRYKCKNKGICCNIFCLEKHKYLKKKVSEPTVSSIQVTPPHKKKLEIDFNTPPLHGTSSPPCIIEQET